MIEKFPLCVYRPTATGVESKAVGGPHQDPEKNEADLKQAITDGWALHPSYVEDAPDVVIEDVPAAPHKRPKKG